MDIVGEFTLEEMRRAAWYNAWIYNYFKSYLQGDILEIGCGIGNFTTILKNSGFLTSIDVNQTYITRLRQTVKGVDMGLGDIEKNNFFFSNKKFDSVIGINVFEHIRNDEKAIENVYRILKKKGYFLILVPAHSQLFSNFDRKLGHYRRYSKKSLFSKLVSAGFTVVDIRYFNWWAAVGWFVFMNMFNSQQIPQSTLGIFDRFGKYFLSIERTIPPIFGLSVVAICKK